MYGKLNSMLFPQLARAVTEREKGRYHRLCPSEGQAGLTCSVTPGRNNLSRAKKEEAAL